MYIAENWPLGIAIITDNREHGKMGTILREKYGMLEFGCAARQMNLVAKDLVKV